MSPKALRRGLLTVAALLAGLAYFNARSSAVATRQRTADIHVGTYSRSGLGPTLREDGLKRDPRGPIRLVGG